ncbi:MAG: M14 family zinc carboxypeptidase [Eubacteriales bacterium]|nr:M14 family zinc carboxypeptidase [Eubacteriales bacterium]
MKPQAVWAVLLAAAVLAGCARTPLEVLGSPAATAAASPVPTATVSPLKATPTPPPAPDAAVLGEGDFCRVAAQEYLSLRVSDSSEALRLAKLAPGTAVHILALHGEFARVETPEGLRGYVMTAYLAAGGEAFSAAQGAAGLYTVVCRETVTLFASASLSAAAATALTPGSAVTVTGWEGDFAACADAAGRRGYVRKDYLCPGGQSTQSFTVRCEEYLTLRAQATLRGKAVGRVPAGARVAVLGYEGNYACVRWQEQTGYVLAGYLTSDEAPGPFTVVKPVENYAFDTMKKDMRALRSAFPGKVTIASLGKTTLGRDIPVLILGDAGAGKQVLLQGAMHGREHMTALLLMAQADALLTAGLPQGVCFYIVPMSNPDGVIISQEAVMTPSLRAIYQSDLAKGYTVPDEAQYLRAWKANAAGVDLNRNFDADFGMGAQRTRPSCRLYVGQSAEDQSESRALADCVRGHDFDAVVSYHAFGSVIYWEYGDKEAPNRRSRSLALALSAVTDYLLEGDTGAEGGGFKDWLVDGMEIPAVTVEIGTRDCPLPLDEFSTIWLRNREVLTALADWVKAQ